MTEGVHEKLLVEGLGPCGIGPAFMVKYYSLGVGVPTFKQRIAACLGRLSYYSTLKVHS